MTPKILVMIQYALLLSVDPPEMDLYRVSLITFIFFVYLDTELSRTGVFYSLFNDKCNTGYCPVCIPAFSRSFPYVFIQQVEDSIPVGYLKTKLNAQCAFYQVRIDI